MNDSSFIPLWQTESWENFQRSLKHKTLRVRGQLLLILPLFFGLSYGYIPRGPVTDRKSELTELMKELVVLSKKHHLVFTRMDPETKLTSEKNLTPSFSPQPETSLVLDLRLSEEDLLNQMKRKGRYNILLAKKKGVTVRLAESAAEKRSQLKVFYQLLQETTKRDGFSGHDQEFYRQLLDKLPGSELLVAYYGGIAIAAGIFWFGQQRAVYYYGASSGKHRELMAPYLIQWEAILEAKKRGCTSYDFLGLAPEGAPKSHPWAGVTAFKKKFGGMIMSYPKPRDLVHKKGWYLLYRILKWLQKTSSGIFKRARSE
ncbi:MAG: peptidoglycan bridge formation glycyltransferase FemA/FemB family protein [bacterium]|nr:peptidoglycan bridge formation glycyltransferase FemA/FemB family protein [bacterium]